MIIGRFAFSGPEFLFWFQPTHTQGLYAILAADPSGRIRLLYIGETSDFTERGFPSSHGHFAKWHSALYSDELLCIAIHETSGLSEHVRRSREKELIREGSPICNIEHIAEPRGAFASDALGISGAPASPGGAGLLVEPSSRTTGLGLLSQSQRQTGGGLLATSSTFDEDAFPSDRELSPSLSEFARLTLGPKPTGFF